MAKNELKEQINELVGKVNIPITNRMLSHTELKDFAMDLNVVKNIAEWALDGKSNNEIRKNLSLDKRQWGILVDICPDLMLIMDNSRQIADIVVAGSLFQTAIGGTVIKKQQPIKMKDFDSDGRVIGEHIEIVEYNEVLPPSPTLLMFLAKNKMPEKFGGVKEENRNEELAKTVNSLTNEEYSAIEEIAKLDDK